MNAAHRPATRRGLTLIEVLIVIAILLAIGGLVVVNLIPKKEQADIDLTKAQIQSFDNALKLFKLDMKRWPTEEEGIRALWSRDALEDEEDAEGWKGPYLENPVPRDTWNNEWTYRYPGEIRGESFYDIISFGPDGEEDTDDDIHNHLAFMGEGGEIDEEFEDFSMPGDGDGTFE
ncbi:MAG: type II secretion system major pseudopilin GspG [Planctomycetota bacterium]|jgi:general secretion pathway protein G